MNTPATSYELPKHRTWAADTGCFTQPHRHDNDRYLAWLSNKRKSSGPCLFATAPDVVADAEATLERSLPMLGRIREVGVPAALVAQDGMTPGQIPWDEIDVLFIGGTTEWKLGPASAAVTREAVRRGKWVHMGRVNSLKRLRIAQGMGCRSADGTVLAFGPDANMPRIRYWVDELKRQPLLPLEGACA